MSDEHSKPVIFHREWRRPRPRLVIYRAADRGFRCVWNRYDTATIGCAVLVGRVCLSLVWARPRAEQP